MFSRYELICLNETLMNEIPSVDQLHILILRVDDFLMGTKHRNRQVLQIYTTQILIIFLMSNEYCCR